MTYENIDIDIDIDVGIIVEKVYNVDLFCEYLGSLDGVTEVQRSFHPKWGEDFVYFKYTGFTYLIISAKGASVAINAVERVRRAHGRLIVFIGTCGSTDISIKDGSIVIPYAAVRDESASQGYLQINVPALADMEFTQFLLGYSRKYCRDVLDGAAFTTDKRYKESPQELKFLNKAINVKYVDMETSAILVVAAYHHIKAAGFKIVTDCAVKDVEGDLKGIYDRESNGDFLSFVNPILIQTFKMAVEASSIYYREKVCLKTSLKGK